MTTTAARKEHAMTDSKRTEIPWTYVGEMQHGAPYCEGAVCTHEYVRQISEHDVECTDCGLVSA